MIWEHLTTCCELAESSLNGTFGWFWDIVTILAVLLVFNFFFKRLLHFLAGYFHRKNQMWKESFVSALYKPLTYYIWFFAVLETAALILTQSFVNFSLPKDFILGVVGIFALGWFLLRWKVKAIKCILAKEKFRNIAMNRTKIDVVDKLLTVAIFIFIAILLLNITGSNLNTLVAFGGISGLALAFASQEVIASFFGGLMIYLTHPFAIGDWIVLPEKSIEGHVEEIGWYITKIRTFEKQPIYVPNSIFSKIVVVNPSRMSHRRIKETFGVRYKDASHLKEVITAMREMLKNDNNIEKDMAATVHFTAFGESSLDILLSAYTSETTTGGFQKIKEQLLFNIIDILNKYQVELAFPTTCIEVVKNDKDVPL